MVLYVHSVCISSSRASHPLSGQHKCPSEEVDHLCNDYFKEIYLNAVSCAYLFIQAQSLSLWELLISLALLLIYNEQCFYSLLKCLETSVTWPRCAEILQLQAESPHSFSFQSAGCLSFRTRRKKTTVGHYRSKHTALLVCFWVLVMGICKNWLQRPVLDPDWSDC